KKSGKKRYDYRFLTSCQSNINHPHNVYWCKFFCLQNILELNQYDYVVFLDSDTVIANYDIDFATLLAGYESDWFMGIDRLYEHRLISPDLVELSTNRTANVRNPNAGVVGVRNSKRGNEIIDAIIDTYNEDNFQSKCVKDGKLIGMWAGVCYEQGVMIQVLFDKYRDYLTILSPDIIHNWYSCTGSFIIHLFGIKKHR
ncbi:MAG: hypothetical protein EBS95_02465, partial [Chitinophagia bacterium]|nr:hypothetical protein [Chitinophagia bacterium]